MRVEETSKGFIVKFDSENEFYDYEDAATSLTPGEKFNVADQSISLIRLWDRINASFEMESATSFLPTYSKACTKGWPGSKGELLDALDMIYACGEEG